MYRREGTSDSQIWMALSDWTLNAELDSVHADTIQAAFESQDSNSLIYRGAFPALQLKIACRQVAAKPLELKMHVRRVYLAIRCRNSAQVYGALIDLLIVLRFSKSALFQRLVEQAAPLLGDDAKGLLHINKPVSAAFLAGFDTSCSVLINGNTLPALYKKKKDS